MMIFFVFWADAEGFWNRVLATALPVSLLGLGSMGINGAVTGRVRLSWLFGPIIIGIAVWVILILVR